jgi:hypothetical protein
MELLRTRTDGCFQLQSNIWGRYLAPASDPLADTVITTEQLEGFELSPDLSRIPASLWNRWINLCIEILRQGNTDLEVSCRFLRNIEDPSKYRIAVPEQRVTSVSVRVDSFDKAVDIETGEVIAQWPPEGWRPCGSSHSHNTMQAFFSGTDDQYELGDPGLHIVVGTINVTTGSYALKASITGNMRRFEIDADDVLDLNIDVETTYHPAVLKVITIPRTATRPLTTNTSYGFDDFSDYSPVLRTREPAVSTFVQGDYDDILALTRSLVKRCNDLQISASDVLHELAFDIDDLAMDAQPNELYDPFYWSA